MFVSPRGGEAQASSPKTPCFRYSFLQSLPCAQKQSTHVLNSPSFMSCASAAMAASPASQGYTSSFRPCIDIHQGKVKQIVGSTLKDEKGGR